MLPLINSFFKYLSVIGCYDPIGQQLAAINCPNDYVSTLLIVQRLTVSRLTVRESAMQE